MAIGADAALLNSKLKLKLNCARKRLCKIGIPKNSMDKYIMILNRLGYSYIILDYNKNKKSITKRYEYDGEKINRFIFNKNSCHGCENNKFIGKSDYEIALNTYLKEEFGEDCIW